MSDRRTIALEVKLDGRQVESETICLWAGPRALTVATTLPETELAFELTSTFVGQRGVPTHATHLALGPPGHAPAMRTDDHEHLSLDPNIKARACVYEHVEVLLEHLTQLGYRVAIDVPDDAFHELERVEN